MSIIKETNSLHNWQPMAESARGKELVPGQITPERMEELNNLTDEEKRRKKLYWVPLDNAKVASEYILYKDRWADQEYHLFFDTPARLFENYFYAFAYMWKKRHA